MLIVGVVLIILGLMEGDKKNEKKVEAAEKGEDWTETAPEKNPTGQYKPSEPTQ